MTDDERVLARMAALEAELKADPAVQAEVHARKAARLQADRAAGGDDYAEGTLAQEAIADEEADAGGAAIGGETKEQRRARLIARLKAERAAKAAAPGDPDAARAAARAKAIARLKAQRAAKDAAAAAGKPATAIAKVAVTPTITDDDDDAEFAALMDARAAKAPARKPAPAPVPALRDKAKDLGDAVDLVQRAAAVKDELARPPAAHEKSWLVGGGLSFLLGPFGWLYAGVWREAIPASVGYVAIASLLSILPSFLLMPVLMVVMPVSAIVGVIYTVKFNRAGRRQRVFGENVAPAPKKLKASRGPAPVLGDGKRRR